MLKKCTNRGDVWRVAAGDWTIIDASTSFFPAEWTALAKTFRNWKRRPFVVFTPQAINAGRRSSSAFGAFATCRFKSHGISWSG
jgi:hypothetical protein